MDSKIDQEVIDELISMLEDHIAGGLKPEESEDIPEEAEAVPGIEVPEAEVPAEDEDDEDMRKLMEHYSRS